MTIEIRPLGKNSFSCCGTHYSYQGWDEWHTSEGRLQRSEEGIYFLEGITISKEEAEEIITKYKKDNGKEKDLDKWQHHTLVKSDGQVKHYVNGDLKPDDNT